MDVGADRELAEVHHALDGYVTGLEHLIKVVGDAGLAQLAGGSELVEFMQAFERSRNLLPLIDHALIAEAERLDLSTALCQGDIRRVLTSVLSLSKPEAGRRVKAAEAVGSRVSMLGEALPPIRPFLAAAQRSGEVSAEKVAIIASALGQVDRRGFDPAEIDAGEQLLAEQAMLLPPEDVKRVADRVVDAIDPDGTLPDEQLNLDRRFFDLRPTRDGAWKGEFRLTGSAGAKLKTLIDPLSKVRVDESGETDTRTVGQRRHDAMEDICDRQLRAGDTPDAGGVPATVIVTINLDDLLARCGYGTTSDGTIIPVETLLEMADNAEIIPAVLNDAGQVLSLGRSRRIASRGQTLALIARDAGCSFPGCAHPPQYCERHHIVEWVNGGPTDLANLTLVCRYHHHNFLARGWQIALNADGIPEWRPPRWVDRDQKPLINTRIVAIQLGRQVRKTRGP